MRPSKGARHLLAALSLVCISILPAYTTDITSAQTGDWSQTATWIGGAVPTANDPVTIAAGHIVTIDVMTAVSSTATINGTLKAGRVASSSWTLVGGDINVNAGGTLDYGNEADPIPTALNAYMVLSSGTYTGQYGLIVNNGGNFTVRGSTKAPYAFATQSITTSDTSLTVYGSTSTDGWQAGDTIIIGPTSGTGTGTTVSRTITNISAGPLYTITWSGGTLSQARINSATSPIIVANLTRNVLVRSSGTAMGSSAYISNLAQNTTSFALTQGEFAYLGANIDGKYAITFDGALTRGIISSTTVHDGYSGVYLNMSSNNTFIGNVVYSNASRGIFLWTSSNNILTGNHLCSHSDRNFSLHSASNNIFSGNYSYSTVYAIPIEGGSNSNYLTDNYAFANSHSGLFLAGSSYNVFQRNKFYASGNGIYISGASTNIFAENDSYANSNGIVFYVSADNNTLVGNNIYSNTGYGVFNQNSSGNNIIAGNIGYNAAGASLNSSIAEIYHNLGATAETLILKGVRVNPAVGISTAGMDVAGAYLLSYNQDYSTGTVRLWGNYQLAGSTLTLDYAAQLYTSTNTAPKLMRGTGHSITSVVTHDADTLSELITVTHIGGNSWQVIGSSSGYLDAFTRAAGGSYNFSHAKVNFTLTAGATLNTGDSLDFMTIAASNDANIQKKLLFGPAASAFNNGRSKLETDSTGGILLRGKTDGTAHTLIDWLNTVSTYYTFVDSGAFTAEHSSFTNMDPGGIQLSGDKGVAISSCTFDHMGFASGTNTYITARDLTSNATFYDVTFGLSRSSAGFASAYNVRVEGGDSGLAWRFLGEPAALGPMWDETYDYDPNGKVEWNIEIPPAAVADLAASPISTGAVSLDWTSPGADESAGILNNSAFIIQYTSVTANAQNALFWSTAAAQITISTTGVSPGTSQYYTLGGLSANTSYYFRLWTKDDEGNYSALSNGATALTLIESPASVYFDEVGTTTIVASAYAPVFTGMERGISGVNLTTSGVYEVWGSTGNYWTTKAAMPTIRDALAAGVIGGKLYAVGGDISGGLGGFQNNNEEYDPVSDTWNIKAAMPTPRYWFTVGVITGKLYAVGGHNGSVPLNANEEYDPISNTWAAKAAMPTARHGLSAGVIGGKLYTVGGAPDWTNYLNTNEEYDPATNTWAAKAVMPIPHSRPAVGVINGKLYAVGGYNGDRLNLNEVYDPAVNSWDTKTAMPTARDNLAAGVIGGKLYAVGGWSGSAYLNANEEYDPAADAWRTKAPMSAPRRSLSAGVISGRLYAVGGHGGSYSNTNEEYSSGAAASFTGLTPNTLYTFKAKARNQAGVETGESVTVSTYTLAALGPAAGEAFTNVFASSVTVNWSSGTAADGYNGPGAVFRVEASTAADFTGAKLSSSTAGPASFTVYSLLPNTTYHFRLKAYNSAGVTDNSWLVPGSTLTQIETPTSVYFDEVGTTTITASAYARAFSGLERGGSGVNITTSGVYGVWGSTGNYWTEKAAIPTARIAPAAALRGKLYVIGGHVDSTYYNTNEEYDPAANTWAAKAAIPTARKGAAVKAIGGKVYVVGGFNGGYLNTNEEYDPEANTWAARASMPTPRTTLAAGVINGKLYAVGGYIEVYLNNNEEYDPVANTWSAKAGMPTPRYQLSAEAVGGRLYAVGGYNYIYLNSNEEYNPATNTWASKAVMPTARHSPGSGAAGGKLYAMGGYNGTNLGVNEEYDPGANTWTAKAAMITPRDSVGIGAIGGKLYAVSSWLASGKNINEEYTPGVALSFAGLTPNTLYAFKAKARNQGGTETGESAWVSTYTLAAAGPAAGTAFTNVFASSLTVHWSSGTAAAGFNGPGAGYKVQVSARSDFLGVYSSSLTYALQLTTAGLLSNTTYYFRAQTYNAGGMSDYSWASLGAALTAIETPAGVYFDEVGTTTIVASAYAPAFAWLERGVSGVNLTTSGVYGVWGSTGNYWTTKAAMPTPRQDLAAGVLGGRLYAVGGVSAYHLNQNEEYDPVSNTWAVRAAMPTNRSQLAAGAVGGKLYAIGGWDGTNVFNKNEEYDPATNAWTTRAVMPTARRYLTAPALNGKLYVTGGYNGSTFGKNEEYDPVSNTWTTRAAMLSTRYNFAAAAVNGRLYAVGGIGATLTNLNEEYNPASNTWAVKAAMPTPRDAQTAAVAGGKLYVIGGPYNEAYDPAANTWAIRAAMPTNRTSLAAGAAGGKIYVLGGTSFSNKNEEYDSGLEVPFTGLMPNTLYTFKAKARNQGGAETVESPAVSTYTLATAARAAGEAVTEVFASSVTVNWSSGTAAGGFNGPGASFRVEASTAGDFLGVKLSSSAAGGLSFTLYSLLPNTTYHFRIQAFNSAGVTDHSWLVLGSTLTRIETPAGVYFDEVGTTTIVASAFAPSPAFTNISAGLSGAAVAMDGAYTPWRNGNRWTAKAAIPTAREAFSAGAIGGKLYAVGGNNGNDLLNTNEEYDPAANTWAAKAPMPTVRDGLAAGVIGGKLYAVGGWDWTFYINANEEYDPEADAWAAKAPIPTARCYLSAGAAGGRLYALGGNNGSWLNTNEEYDPAADRWTNKAPMPTARGWLLARAIGGKVYAVGGNNAASDLNANQEYDPASNVWVNKTAIPTARSGLAGGVIGGKLYAVGGYYSGILNVNQEYDPAANVWVTKAAMPTARDSFSAETAGGRLYAFGGSPAVGVTNINQEYDPGAGASFTGLTPNTQHSFKAKARNATGVETGDSAGVSTYTLAVVARAAGPAFTNVIAYSITVNWSSGTAAGGYNGPGAGYKVQASTAADFSGVCSSSVTYSLQLTTAVLSFSTTYYFRVQAYNAGGATDHSWLPLGSTATLANLEPALDWTGETGYEADGLNPETGDRATNLVYRVKYTDPDNDAPLSGYPKLYILKGGTTVQLLMMNYVSGSNTAGAVYSTSTVLSGLGADYSYHFEAYDMWSATATGAPAAPADAPDVLNNAPALAWAGGAGYTADGLNPETGDRAALFAYRVTYTDADNDAPLSGYPRVYILKGGATVQLLAMNYVSGTNTAGAVYSTSTMFSAVGADYSYHFEAYDVWNATAAGVPAALADAPDVLNNVPALAWAGGSGYTADGLDPETGDLATSFVYRVKYTDADNDAPLSGYPRLYILKSGATVQLLTMNFASGSNAAGAVYSTATQLSALGADYSYHFEAYDALSDTAAGTPAWLVDAPDVLNNAPVLAWTGEPDYAADGLNPESGDRTTVFVYRVKYTDSDNNTPLSGYPKVYVLKGGTTVQLLTMNHVSGTNTAGAVYSTATQLSALGADYSYHFEAYDILSDTAVGAPTGFVDAPDMLNSAPVLSWTGETNYAADGLNPETGDLLTGFVYRVKYSDADNEAPGSGFPRVHIKKGGAGITGSPFTMAYVSGAYVAGAVYTYQRTLDSGADYVYYFEARDANGAPASSGAPVSAVDAPDTAEIVRQENYKTTLGDNIFSPKTGGTVKIKFYVPRAGKASLKIYDLSGKLIKNLLDGDFGPGDFQKDWDGKDNSGRYTAPGFYFLHYSFPGGKEVRKLGVKK